MELRQQHRAPRLLQRVIRVLGGPPHCGGGRPEFGLPQQVLAAAVAPLGARLRCVGAAMELEVEFPGPHGRVRILGLRGFEEASRGGQFHPRRALQRAGTMGGGDHFPRWTAATVPPPEWHQRRVGRPLFGILTLRQCQLLPGQLRVIRVDRGEVCENPGTVDPFPTEGVVRHPVCFVPGDLLGQKPAGTGGRHDLRQRRRIAERVGQPDLERLDAEFLHEEPFAGHELAGECLPAGHVRVGLHPHPAHRNEAARGDGCPHPFEELRVGLLEPGVLLGG